ncbi:MAG: hypothetical protein C0608_06840 [Deltaproteobacteria bacterium]|nr:MAG: hypothetical protein C0608_06840 [Deltaproteobacteria bacterium]
MLNTRATSALFIIIALSALFMTPLTYGAEILLPKPRSAFDSEFVTVIGKGNPGETILWQHIRATSVDQAEATVGGDGFFNLTTELDPGINRLNISGQYLELFFDDGSTPLPMGFFPKRHHAGDISQCQDCHDTGTQLADGGFPYVCLACHVVFSQNPANSTDPMADSHFSSVISKCGSCHDSHISDSKKMLKESNEEGPCKKCHSQKYAGWDNHAAFEEGGCMACHDAHYSGFPKGLYSYMPELCHQCHSQGDDVDENQFHPPGAALDGSWCVTCHDPHSNSEKLLASSTLTLCTTCHNKVLSAGHGDELEECTLCHDPHRAVGTGLLNAEFPAGCEECHDGMTDSATVHPPVEEGCQLCHSPHSDTNLSRAQEMCLECHNFQQDLEVAAIHGNLPLELKDCLMCHPAHDSDEDILVRAKTHFPLTQGKCDSCHGAGEAISIKIDDTSTKCGTCHSILRDLETTGTEPHSPVVDDGCQVCHNPHMSPNRAYLELKEPAVCRQCHDDIPEGSDGRTLHPAAETCTDCHKPHGGQNNKMLIAEGTGLCLECHDDPTDGKQQTHDALDEGCATCHNPHAGFGGGLLVDEMAAVCSECHDDPAEKEHVHSALDEGCTACHNPHASDNAKLLNVNVDELCIECHDNPEDEYQVVHSGLEEGCTACHLPHSSDNANLLVSPDNGMCFECHDDPAEQGEAHSALDEGCTACHNPHGSANENMLSASPDEICIDCHDDMTAGKAITHDALDEGCTTCHLPHASANSNLLTAPVNELCKECHEDHDAHTIDGTYAGEWGGAKPFPVSGEELACTGCHAPHSADEGALFAAPENDLCTSCH